MEVLNNENQEVNEQENGTELTVVKKEGLLTKAVKGAKKHGKKIVGAVILCGAGIAAYALGKKAGSKQGEDCEDLVIYDLDVEDIPSDDDEE